MIMLAVDTCDARGSVAVFRNGALAGQISHDSSEDYSGWLIPACDRLLGRFGLNTSDVELYAVASGPGSFTGVRVGLTATKAWAEVYAKPVVPVSRLEAVASQSNLRDGFAAALIDAHRKQIFGALYAVRAERFERVGDEMVLPPADFRTWVSDQVGARPVAWASPDMSILRDLKVLEHSNGTADSDQTVLPPLAEAIGRLGLKKFQSGEAVDALHLDANYVRRSDAELLWKGADRSTSSS
jgi:tRNA threonylcarbamoyladenosine biosynthesis protein TsaB